MKLTTAVIGTLLAGSVSASFDKWAPWGKRDYPCVNVIQGIPENATLAPGTGVSITFNRDTDRCGDLYDHLKADPYNLWLYNNPVRNLGNVQGDVERPVRSGIPESQGEVVITIPTDLPAVEDSSVWYLRLSTSIPDAPQYPSLFFPIGPFTIKQ